MSYIKEILSSMENKIKDNASLQEVSYGKGLIAYSQPDYETALTELKVFAGVIPDNTEVNYYIELLQKMLGKQNKPENANKKPDEFPGLDNSEPDPLLSTMSHEEYIDFKLHAAVMDFNQGHYDSSVKDCLYAIRVDSKKELGYVRLGSAYYALGLEKYALKAWQKALELNPNNSDLKEFMTNKKMPLK
jgi:tetratricopeptide (TPR) repeat protein